MFFNFRLALAAPATGGGAMGSTEGERCSPQEAAGKIREGHETVQVGGGFLLGDQGEREALAKALEEASARGGSLSKLEISFVEHHDIFHPVGRDKIGRKISIPMEAILGALRRDGKATELILGGVMPEMKDEHGRPDWSPLKSLQSSSVTSLALTYCGLGHKEAEELAKLTSLTSLDLRDNKVGDESAKELAKLTSLTSLYLEFNEVGDEGAKELAKLTSLTSLNLACNAVGDEGLEWIVRDLQHLEHLNIENNNVKRLPLELGYHTLIRDLCTSKNSITFPPPEILERENAEGIEGVKAFLREASEKGLQTFRRAKLALVGRAEAGKTSLLRAMQHNEPKLQDSEDRTKGVDIDVTELMPDPVNDPALRMTTYDFAGQVSYYGMHRAFLTPRSLNLVVFDMSRLKKSVEEEHSDDHEQAFRNEIGYWLGCLSVMIDSPRVLLVGTHADWLSSNEAEDIVSTVKENVKKLYRKSSFERVSTIQQGTHTERDVGQEGKESKRPQSLPWTVGSDGTLDSGNDVTVMSINAGDVADALEVKKAIGSIMNNKDAFPHVGEKLPQSYMNVKGLLDELKGEGIQYVPLQRGLAGDDDPKKDSLKKRVVDRGILTEEEVVEGKLEEILRLWADTGDIVWINQGEMGNIIVVNPPWLAQAFQQILLHDFSDVREATEEQYGYKDNKDFDKACKVLKEEGILDTTILPRLWHRIESEATRKALFMMLQRYRIVLPVVGEGDKIPRTGKAS